MRDLATAIGIFEKTHNAYPGYRNVLLMKNDASYVNPCTNDGGVSWLVPLLPYLDEEKLYDKYRTPRTRLNQTVDSTMPNPSEIANRLDSLICPSDEPGFIGGTPLAYVVNTGCIDAAGTTKTETSLGIPRDWPANGVFFDHFTGHRQAHQRANGSGAMATDSLPLVSQSSKWIAERDGLSHTILLSENVDHGQYADVFEQALGMIWDIDAQVMESADPAKLSPPVAVPAQRSLQINAERGMGAAAMTGELLNGNATYAFSRPSSQHVRGVNVAFCDGHVAYLSETMEYFVYCLLMSPDGKNVKVPGKSEPLGHARFSTPLDERWLRE